MKFAIRACISLRAILRSTKSGSNITSANAMSFCRWSRLQRRQPMSHSPCASLSWISRPICRLCADDEFDPQTSNLIYGPISKPRWIYAASKQLMDRVIWGYGMQEGLNFTLFRPFNWIGPGLDSINTPKEGSSRVVSQFLGQIVRGEPIHLVDGGYQKR